MLNKVQILGFSIIIILLGPTWLKGQEYYNLKIGSGDKIPDFELNALLNSRGEVAHLSDFRGKIVILDFWSRGCSSCIAMFPKIEKLNARYKDHLIIIPVTKDNLSQFKRIRESSRTVREARLPFVIGDSALHKFFPHKYVPYYIWIDKMGRFMESTTPDAISEFNVERVISGKDIVDLEKTQYADSPSESFYTLRARLNKGSFFGLEYFSDLREGSLKEYAKYGVSIRYIYDSSSTRSLGMAWKGQFLIDLFLQAYPGITYQDIKVCSKSLEDIFQPKDRSELKSWYERNLFNYELIMLPGVYNDFPNRKKVMFILREDIYKYLGIVNEVKDIVRPCYVLKGIDATPARYQTENIRDELKREILKNGFNLQNVPMKTFMNEISSHLNKEQALAGFPVVNETGFNGKISILFKCDNFNDIHAVNRVLQQYGLSLQFTQRKLKTLVLTKDDGQTASARKR